MQKCQNIKKDQNLCPWFFHTIKIRLGKNTCCVEVGLIK
jgi:hypothetical protein